MNTPWEEVLDLNDVSESDSDSSLRPLKRHHNTTTTTTTNHSLSQPFLRRCSQTTQTNPLPPPPPQPSAFSKIPGPAGIVQAAMHRRKNQINENRLMEEFLEEEPIPTQEYIRRAMEDSGSVEDDDFTRDPWLSTVDFLRREGMVLNGDGAIGVPLSVINKWASFDKVDQVVAIVKTCTPNGLGDMKVTLKDPTGTVDAYVHHRVFTEGEFGKHISIGAVMILQKVAVFSPSRTAHYLNVALRNVVKVFPKDGSAPLEQNCAASKHVALYSGESAKSQLPHNSSSLSQGRTEGIMTSLRQSACTRADAVIDEQMEQDVQVGSSCHTIGKCGNENVVSRMDRLLVRQELACGTKEVTVGTDTGNDKVATIEQLNSSKKIDGGNILEHDQCGGAAIHLFDASNNLENRDDNGIKNRRPSSSRTSLPQWTDEQLEELFAFD